MKRISVTFGAIFGGLLLTIALASPASAGGTCCGPTPSASPSTSPCPADSFQSENGGCVLKGNPNTADGVQVPAAATSPKVNRHHVTRRKLPFTGPLVPISTYLMIGFGSIIGGVATLRLGRPRLASK